MEAAWERSRPTIVTALVLRKDKAMGKGLLLWLIGIPIPVIIILFLIFR